MMHEDVDNDEEDVILDRRTLIHQANHSNSLSNSGPILLGVNRFNIKVHDNPVQSSRVKTILLMLTCISIGMFTGLLGPTFPFLSKRMPADMSTIVWLIGTKATGFLIGTFLSVYLYAWFNVCCLLGLSCLAISFGICSLPNISDLATFYLTSLVLGVGLAISYNGIDALRHRLWTRSSLASIRWLHLLVAVGALISIIMLFLSNTSTMADELSTNTTTQPLRPRREAPLEIAERLAAMQAQNNDTMFIFMTNTSNTLNYTTMATELAMAMVETTTRVVHKPSIVDTEILKQSNIAKPNEETIQQNEKPPLINSYCCYYNFHTTNQNETILAKAFTCEDKGGEQTDICKSVISFCKNSTTAICLLDIKNTSCRIDRVHENHEKLNCSVELINAVLNISMGTTVRLTPSTTASTTTIVETNPPTTTTTVLSTTMKTTTTTTTTTTAMQTTSTVPTPKTSEASTNTTELTTTTTYSTTHRNKPLMAESYIDDLSKNLFYTKISSFFQSITLIHLIYLLIAFLFFLLGIFYSMLAMRGEGTHTSSIQKCQLNPLSLLFGNFHRTTNHSHAAMPLFSDRASLKFVLLLVIFYFILTGIESSCVYLTYIFGIQLKLKEYQCLLIQFLFFLGLTLGRLIDISMDYGCFLFHTRITNQTKKQSDKFHLVSIKFCIIARLILLFLMYSALSFSHLFQENSTTPSSIPSVNLFYFTYFFIGLLLASLPTLVLSWIERDLSLNDTLIRFILLAITISEIIVPSFLFYTIKHVVLSFLFYLFIGSCLLLILFLFIVYTSKKWQRKQLYRILPTSMEMDEVNIENQSDNNNNNNDDDDDDDGGEYTNQSSRMTSTESKLIFNNERRKGVKGH